jgi:hypothetical protein
VAGALALTRHPLASVAAWITAAAVAYAALYTVAWAIALDAPVLSVCLMAAAAVLSVWCARQVV